jgi:hypothetical protein
LKSTYAYNSFTTEHGCEGSHCFALVKLLRRLG